MLKMPLPRLSRSGVFVGGESLTDVGAGWSSPVARQAHNLKVAGSNPAPATNVTEEISPCGAARDASLDTIPPSDF